MPSLPVRRTIVPLLLALTFTAFSASAAGAQTGRAWATRAAAPTPVERVGRVLGLFASLWGKTGCHIDPSGLCAGSPENPPRAGDRTDTGCHIDPDGRCLSVPAVVSTGQWDEGCHIDPDGSCR